MEVEIMDWIDLIVIAMGILVIVAIDRDDYLI